MILKKDFFYKLMYIIAICSFAVNCENSANSNTISEEVSRVDQTKTPNILKIPTGNEIEIEFKPIEPKKAVVTIKNVSLEDVYLPYLPGLKDDWAFFACLGLEKINNKTGESLPLNCGHIATGMNPLQSGKSFKYLIQVSESGSYRLNFKYLTDQQLVQKLNSSMNLNESEQLSIIEKSRASSGIVTTPIINF